jgi:hypothetical protein
VRAIVLREGLVAVLFHLLPFRTPYPEGFVTDAAKLVYDFIYYRGVRDGFGAAMFIFICVLIFAVFSRSRRDA